MKKIAFAFLILAACASKPNMPGFTYQPIATQHLTIATWIKETTQVQKPLRIYIDGNAKTGGIWTDYPKLTHDVGLQLAKKDKNASVVYLARPCYFEPQEACVPAMWLEGKYAPEVVNEMSQAVDRLRKKYNPTEIELIGYDGGAAISLLLANRIKNLPVKVVTIAGILDVERYAVTHDDPIFADSLNPINEVYLLAAVPQVHYIGGQDRMIQQAYTERFVKRIPNPKNVKIKRVPRADHTNWTEFKLDY